MSHEPTSKPRAPEQLSKDALAIWSAAVEAVRSEVLIKQHVGLDGHWLRIGDEPIDLRKIRRIAVVGAGKAGAGMSAGLEDVLGEKLMAEKNVLGWINVPENCLRSLKHIHLHAARPAGVNEPTEEGVEGTMRILQLVESLGPGDLCICLISGGGSALMPAPADGVTLADKQAVTKHLSAVGANIQQLNTVRKRLSRVKGGGLARACRAGRMISLIISDVLGDPLDIIASGPTTIDTSAPREALDILIQFSGHKADISPRVFEFLGSAGSAVAPIETRITNLIIGNNSTAVDAAGIEAERRGYSHAMWSAPSPEGSAEDLGRHHAEMALRMVQEQGPDCLITGGEPVVKLVDALSRGLGGRNQQLVLASLIRLVQEGPRASELLDEVALLSGGTDGEDGPTDAAGAIIDWQSLHRMQSEKLDPSDFLRRNDAYHFFKGIGGLIQTGPTNTNVCDVRVVVVARNASRK